MKEIRVPRPGPPEVLELREAPDPVPGAGELRIQAEASGVNFADVLGRRGVYEDFPALPAVPGYEVAGRVDAVGPGVSRDWIGRDVFALTRYGGYAERVCTPETRVMERPPGMTAPEGAAFPINYLTAYVLVERMGGLHADETVLIHGAGGGVGVAAVQLARRIGARVIATASAHKHDFLKSSGVDFCIDYTREDFEARVREITRGRGVELVLDPLGGRSFARSCRCLAATGRLGMYGMSDVAAHKGHSWLGVLKATWGTPRLRFTPPALMNRNVGVFGLNLASLWAESTRVASWTRILVDGYREGSLRPVVSAIFPFERASEAHHCLEDRRNVGKVVLLP